MRPLVLDLTRLLPGPLAGRLLAELGFPVMRLLPPSGDPLRQWSEEAHEWLNRGKMTETVDLKTAEGRERLRGLTREAGVLLETNRPGVMERLGLGPAELREVNPALTYVRLAGSREPSHYRSPGHDLTYLCGAGLVTRFPWTAHQFADSAGAFWGVIAALEGLRTGGGFFEVYLEEAALALAYPPLPFVEGSVICYGIYPAKEGAVALAALERHLWEGFCLDLSKEGWLDAAFTPAGPENPLHEEVCALFRTRTADDWEAWAAVRRHPLRAVRGYRPPAALLPWTVT